MRSRVDSIREVGGKERCTVRLKRYMAYNKDVFLPCYISSGVGSMHQFKSELSILRDFVLYVLYVAGHNPKRKLKKIKSKFMRR